MRNRNHRFTWLIIGLMIVICTTSCSSASGGDTPEPVVKHAITFDNNYEGALKAVVMVDKGAKVEQPTKPSRSGYNFDGWYTEQTCVSKYDFDKAVNQDITLYAKWDNSIILQEGVSDSLYTIAGMTEELFGPISINGYTAGKTYKLNGYEISISIKDDTVQNIRTVGVYFKYPPCDSFICNAVTYTPAESIQLGIGTSTDSLALTKTSTGKLLIQRNGLVEKGNPIIDNNYQSDFSVFKYLEGMGYGTALISAYGKNAITVEAYGKFLAGEYLVTN